MVLTRAQSRTKPSSPATKSTKSKPTKTATAKTTTKKAVASQIVEDEQKESVEQVAESKPVVKKTARIESTSTSKQPTKSAIKSTTTTKSASTTTAKAVTKSKAEPEKPTRARRTVQFAEDAKTEKTKAEPAKASAPAPTGRARVRKEPISTASTTATVRKSSLKVKAVKQESKPDPSSSVLGKPIRARKPVIDSSTSNATASRTAAKSVTVPIIDAKDKSVELSITNSISLPALKAPHLSPVKSLGSPMRLPASPTRPVAANATPMRLPMSAIKPHSALKATNQVSQPQFHPVQQSPIRHSAIKNKAITQIKDVPIMQSPIRNSAIKVQTAASFRDVQVAKTPSKSIGTPIRRNFVSSAASKLSWTQAPPKRSIMESPTRPQSAHGAKRIKLVATPQQPKSADNTWLNSCLRKTEKAFSVSKAVSFMSPKMEVAEEDDEDPFVDMPSPTQSHHRMSRVTEVTEPEDSTVFVEQAIAPEAAEEAEEISELEVVLEAPLEEDQPFQEKGHNQLPPLTESESEPQTTETEQEMLRDQMVTIIEDEISETHEAIVLDEILEQPAILEGMTFYLDVWTADKDNANMWFSPLLLELGAQVVSEWSDQVTHVLFKGGEDSTLRKVIASDGVVKCMNVSWAVE